MTWRRRKRKRELKPTTVTPLIHKLARAGIDTVQEVEGMTDYRATS
jgi:hypothetical protein